MKKGTYGYINNKKTKNLLFSLLLFAIALAIFFIGYFLNNREKNNVFSIAAVLLILPAAKVLVSYIVVMPFKSPEKLKYDKIESLISPDMIFLSDLVITSTEKIMNLDFIVIASGNIIGLMGKQTQDISYITTYLSHSIKNQGSSYHVKVFKEYKPFIERVTTVNHEEDNKKSDEKIKDFILTLSV